MLLITVISILVCGIHAILLHTQFNHYVYTSALKIMLFVLSPMVYFAVSKQGGFKEMFSKGIKKNIQRSFVLGLVVFFLIWIIFFVLRPFLDEGMIVDALAQNGITSDNFPLVFLYVILINAVLEEIFFRGFVFMTLYRMNYRRYAYAYACLLFAFYHVAILNNAVAPGVFIFLIAGLGAAGLIFNYLVVSCKSLTGSLIVHISANLALNLMVLCYLHGLF